MPLMKDVMHVWLVCVAVNLAHLIRWLPHNRRNHNFAGFDQGRIPLSQGFLVFALGARPEEVTFMGFLVIAS